MPAEETKRGRGRAPLLSEPIIADAALALIAETSAADLTMQAVASRLGVRHSALYRHVADRRDLLRLVADRHVELMGFPEPEDSAGWREFLTASWALLDDGCARYPGLAELVYASVWPPPQRSIAAGLRLAQALIQRWSFPEPLAMLAVDLVLDFTIDARSRVDRILSMSPEWSGFGDALHEGQELSEAFERHLEGGPREWTLAKLDVILDGLETALHRSSDKL